MGDVVVRLSGVARRKRPRVPKPVSFAPRDERRAARKKKADLPRVTAMNGSSEFEDERLQIFG
jgi:hypothetical protein